MVRSGLSLPLVKIHIHVASSALCKKQEVVGRKRDIKRNLYCSANIVRVKDDEIGVTCNVRGRFAKFVKYVEWGTSRKEH
jgi:hypothetical protein